MSETANPTADASPLLESIVIETREDGTQFTAADAVELWHEMGNAAEVYDE